MSTQAERIVRIEHPDTGRRYAVSEQTFKHTKMDALGGQTYEDAGYKIMSYEDGREYGEGKEPTAYAINATASTPEIGATEEASTASAPTPARTRSSGVTETAATASTETEH